MVSFASDLAQSCARFHSEPGRIVVTPRSRKYDISTIRAALEKECPSCHEKIPLRDLHHEADNWRNTRCPRCGHASVNTQKRPYKIT
jgi:endogenous inhibitor of DNA gyrase (YacG/DUF329 family)